MNIDLKSTWRAAKQHRLYTAINVTGLFFGFIVGALLILYIHAERHFDAHAKDIDTIFRINSRVEVGGTSFKTGTGPAPLADTLVREVAGVEDAARLVKNDRVLVKRDNEVFAEEHFYYSQSSLFHFFDYDFIEGTPQGAL